MLSPTRIGTIVFLIALSIDCAGVAFGAAAGKGSVNQHGARAAAQMSAKGASNNNAQWSADPVRGWVRADERHKMQQKNAPSTATRQRDGTQKGRGKGKQY